MKRLFDIIAAAAGFALNQTVSSLWRCLTVLLKDASGIFAAIRMDYRLRQSSALCIASGGRPNR